MPSLPGRSRADGPLVRSLPISHSGIACTSDACAPRSNRAGTCLRAALESGGDLPAPFPAGAPDAINNAGLPGWRAIPGPTARREFEEASAEVDAFLAALDEATAERIRAGGLGRNLERFRHRGEHAEAIEAGLRR